MWCILIGPGPQGFKLVCPLQRRLQRLGNTTHLVRARSIRFVEGATLTSQGKIATFLIVLLMAVASAAGACEIRCNLALKSGIGCKAAADGHSMAGMAAMQAVNADRAPSDGSALKSPASHLCDAHLCTTQPAVVRHQLLGSLIAGALLAGRYQTTALVTEDEVALMSDVRGSPPRRTPVSLHTLLRI